MADQVADDLFHDAYKRRKALPDTFGETHAKLAVKYVDESTALGERLFENMQSMYYSLVALVCKTDLSSYRHPLLVFS